MSRLEDSVWGSAVEVPRAGLPDAKRLARKMRMYQVVVWASVVLFPFVALAAFVGLASPSRSGVVSAVDGSSLTEAQIAASVELNEWLGSPKSPFGSEVTVAGWVSEVVIDSDVFGGDIDPEVLAGVVLVSERFVVDTVAGEMIASVEVIVDPRGGVSVVAGPSFIPANPNLDDGWNGVESWPGLNSKPSFSVPVKRSVVVWATAVLSGDPETLRLAVGDPDLRHAYIPFPAAVDVSAVVVDSAMSDSASDELVARVAVSWVWSGVPDGGSGPVVFDVLVEAASTAAPRVVAWGAPGEGPLLAPFDNAVKGTRLIEPELSPPSATEPPPVFSIAPVSTTSEAPS